MKLILLLILIPLFFGCASPQTKQLLDSPLTLPKDRTSIDVPFVGQKDLYCGPATLSMALQNKGLKIHQNTIAKHIFTPGRKGTFQFDMTSFARQQGMVVYPVKPTLNALLNEVASGHPVIVLQNLGFSWLPRWHYALAVGYDLSKKKILLHSGKNKNYGLSLSTFERTWSRAKNWGFALLANAEFPSENAPEKLTDAVIESDLFGHHKLAKTFYEKIVSLWPDQHIAWFALGNRHYKDGDLEPAIAAFHKASQLAEQESYYNNLAYSIAEYGCKDYAFSVIDCALRFSPNSAILKNTQQEIVHFTTSKQSCPSFICQSID